VALASLRLPQPSGSAAQASMSVRRQATLREPIFTRFGNSPRFSSLRRVMSWTRETASTSAWRRNGDSSISGNFERQEGQAARLLLAGKMMVLRPVVNCEKPRLFVNSREKRVFPRATRRA
jgi:hypothetical protein